MSASLAWEIICAGGRSHQRPSIYMRVLSVCDSTSTNYNCACGIVCENTCAEYFFQNVRPYLTVCKKLMISVEDNLGNLVVMKVTPSISSKWSISNTLPAKFCMHGIQFPFCHLRWTLISSAIVLFYYWLGVTWQVMVFSYCYLAYNSMGVGIYTILSSNIQYFVWCGEKIELNVSVRLMHFFEIHTMCKYELLR